MNKRTWINTISVLAGIVVVGGIILVKHRPSPKPRRASKAELNRVAATPPLAPKLGAATPSPAPQPVRTATPLPKGTPAPTATPTPLIITMLTEEQAAQLKAYLQLVADQKSALQDEMLPPVESLYQRDEEMVFRWAEDASWPVHPYKEKLKEFEEERAQYYPLLPVSYRQLDELLQEAGNILVEAANKFEHRPTAPKEFPPEKLKALKVLFAQIDQTQNQLLQEL